MSIGYAPGKFVTSGDGTKIWAADHGNPSKPAVVFIHGFACVSDAFEKQYNDATMLENLHIIRYDVRGCGRSEGPHKPDAYVSERQAEDFKAVIDSFNVTKPFVATWSIGGIIPPDVIEKYGPDCLSGQIMMGSFPHRNMHSEVVHPVILKIIPGLLSEDPALFAIAVHELILSCVAPTYELPYKVYTRWLGGAAPRAPIVRQCMFGRTQNSTAIEAIAPHFPYISIQGEDDQHVIPLKLEKWMKDHLGRSEFHLLPGVGHAPFFEAPEITNSLILQFVRKYSMGT